VVHHLQVLPKTTSGKILRKDLPAKVKEVRDSRFKGRVAAVRSNEIPVMRLYCRTMAVFLSLAMGVQAAYMACWQKGPGFNLPQVLRDSTGLMRENHGQSSPGLVERVVPVE
jgi:hypothetical protein